MPAIFKTSILQDVRDYLTITLGLYFLIKKKGWTPVKCIGLLLVVGLLGALVGIF